MKLLFFHVQHNKTRRMIRRLRIRTRIFASLMGLSVPPPELHRQILKMRFHLFRCNY